MLNRYVVQYGTNAMAALGITMKIYMVIMLVMVGFAFGAQPLLGYNYGAKNFKRLKAIIRFDLFVEVVYALILAVLLMLLAPHLVALFMHSSAVIADGTVMVRVLLISTPAVGVCLVMTTLFQTVGAAPAALVMAIARQGVIFFPAIIVLHAAFGYLGVLWAQPAADVLTMLVGLWLFRRHFHKILQNN